MTQFTKTIARLPWTVACSFEDTVVEGDPAGLALERHALNEWRTVECDWLSGTITAQARLRAQVALLRCGETDLLSIGDAILPLLGFDAFVERCEGRGMAIVVVSDGFGILVRRTLERAGLGHLPVFANEVAPAPRLGRDRWSVVPPQANAGCQAGTCGCRAVHGAGRVLLIGSRAVDLCFAARADFVLARRGLLAQCRLEELPHAGFQDFTDPRALLSHLPVRDAGSAPSGSAARSPAPEWIPRPWAMAGQPGH